MTKNSRNLLIGGLLTIVAAGAYVMLRPASSVTSPVSGADASATVTAFGNQLQKVSLLAPDVSQTIGSTYAPYVTPALLADWQANPSHAPGKETSSPWPDHIQITTVVPQGTGYMVSGGVVMMTSTSLAGVVPVVILVVPQDGKWLIAAYQEQAVPSSVE